MLSAWLAGFGPGLLSACLCTAAIDYFWTEPRYAFFHRAPELALFFLIAVAMSKLIDSLRDARARADAARHSSEQMLDIVTHGLRSPFRAQQGTNAVVRARARDPDFVVPRLDALDRAVDRSDKLIRDLVDASQPERGALSVTLQDENVGSLAREVTDIFEPLV